MTRQLQTVAAQIIFFSSWDSCLRTRTLQRPQTLFHIPSTDGHMTFSSVYRLSAPDNSFWGLFTKGRLKRKGLNQAVFRELLLYIQLSCGLQYWTNQSFWHNKCFTMTRIISTAVVTLFDMHSSMTQSDNHTQMELWKSAQTASVILICLVSH